MGRASTPVASSGVLGLTIGVLVLWNFSEVVQCLSLTIDRATAKSLLLEIRCDSCEKGSFTWEYKSSRGEPWGRPPRLYDHLFNGNAYYISGLKENALHFVRVLHNSSGAHSNEIEEWTCEPLPPPVTQLRVANAGPGWFDIRWNPPREKCKSFYYYDVRYKPSGGSFKSTKRFGYFDESHSRAYVRPSHPCSGKDFCVLLTDYVIAGRIHEIELQMERIGGNELERSEMFRLIGIANIEPTDQFTGHDNYKTCVEKKMHAENVSNGDVNTNEERSAVEGFEVTPHAGGIVLPMWVAISLGVLFFVVLATIVGLWVKSSVMKPVDDKQKADEIPLPPTEYMEERYVDSGEMAFLASGKKTEYDDEVPVYEEIDIHKNTQTGCISDPFPYKHCKFNFLD